MNKKNKIPYGNHYIDNNDILLVNKSLKSELLTGGYYNKKFTTELKKYLGTKYVTLCSSGTSALHLAFLSINLESNDIIIMPAINFVASYNMAKNLGAKIFLADVDKNTGQMTTKNVEDCIKKNNLKKIKCILNMFLGGSPENIEKFYKLKKKYNCFLIEDSCHAFGSKYEYKNNIYKVGSNFHSDISTFSFHPVKSIATGEGGCLTTRSKKIYERSMILRNHGLKKNKKKHWDYDVIENGYNYRLDDISAALGLSQLKKINKFIGKRNKIVKLYKKELKEIFDFIKFPNYSKKIFNCYHLLIVNIDFKKLNTSKDFFLSYMLKNNITCQYHYKPIYKFKIYNKSIKSVKDFPNSEIYYKNSLSLPIFYKLKTDDIFHITNKIKNFIKNKANY